MSNISLHTSLSFLVLTCSFLTFSSQLFLPNFFSLSFTELRVSLPLTRKSLPLINDNLPILVLIPTRFYTQGLNLHFVLMTIHENATKFLLVENHRDKSKCVPRVIALIHERYCMYGKMKCFSITTNCSKDSCWSFVITN